MMPIKDEIYSYDSINQIINDNRISEKEKIIFSQLLDMCSFRKEYNEENYREFVELVKNPDKRPPLFIFSRLVCRKFPIEIRKKTNWEEVKWKLHELDKEIQEKLGWDLENFGPSFSKFVEKYGIVPIDFQIRSWKKILLSDKKYFVITAPTGFGKTECFLLPVIFSLFRHKIGDRDTSNSTAAFIYPRRILIEDQASRLVKAIKDLWEVYKDELSKKNKFSEFLHMQPIILGLQKGEIPKDFDEKELEKVGILKKDEKGTYLSLIKCIHPDGVYNFRLIDEDSKSLIGVSLKGVFQCEKCGFKIFISLSRNNHKKILTEIKDAKRRIDDRGSGSAPFILLTTFESLERLFLESDFSEFFKNLEYIVVDEAHVYQSIYGLHISHILKELFEILELYGNNLEKLKLIFSSATLPTPSEFVSKLLSFKNVTPNDIEEIKRNPAVDSQLLPGCYKYFIYLLTKPHIYPLKPRALIQTVMYFAHVINKVYEDARLVAFFDTKGSLRRLIRQYNDAERRKLFRYRIRLTHNENMPETQRWTLLFDLSNKTWDINKLTNPIQALPVTSEFKEQRGDVMFCTSAFELGVDDLKINSVIQYSSPRTLLSFVQRVGRGNRFRGDRFFLTILDSYEPIDAFYFSHNDLLTEESFEREGVSIPEANKIVERIHEILLKLNKEFLNQSRKLEEIHEEVYINELILSVFRKIVEEENLSFDKDFIDFIKKLEGCSYEDRNNLLKNKEEELKKKYKNLEEEIKVRNLEEIQERVNEILSELERKIRKSLTKQTSEEILEGKSFSNIKKELNTLVDELQHIDESLQLKITTHRDEIEKNLRAIEEDYKSVKLFYDKICRIADEFREKLFEVVVIVRKYVHNELHKEEIARKIVEQDSLFLKLVSLNHLIRALTFRREFKRMLTRWEKFVELLQACFWSNISYLVKENKFFEEYEKLIETLPYVPKSYFEESMEFPVNIWRASAPKEGNMVSDVFVRYFPLKVDFEYIEEQRRAREAILDFEVRKIERKNGILEVIVNPRKGYGYEEGYKFLPKREGTQIYNLPLQVPLKFVREDINGYVRFCFRCFNISSKMQECDRCGGNVVPVKIFGRPLFDFRIKEKRSIKENGKFSLLPIDVLVILRGSENELISPRSAKNEVKIKLRYPFIFPLYTPALVFNLSSVPEEIDEKIFHSLAHALLRTVASLTGFSEEVLFYHYDKQNKKIYIFERYQGGIGVIDKIFKIIEEKKNAFTERLLNIINCKECEKENGEGCPFCLWISWCKEGYRMQSDFISRKKLKEFIEKYKELLF
jgi:ATP-dependent helicase YprA (DUF1998 family)